MVKPRGKNKDEELPLVVLLKGKGVSKKPSAKSTKKNAGSSKNDVVVKEKQSRNRSKEQVAVISTPEGPVELLKNLEKFNKEKEVNVPLIIVERQLREAYAKKKEEEDLKRLHEYKKKLHKEEGTKRTSRNKLVPVKKITKKK